MALDDRKERVKKAVQDVLTDKKQIQDVLPEIPEDLRDEVLRKLREMRRKERRKEERPNKELDEGN